MCSWDGYLGRLRQDMGQEVSLAQTLFRGIVKTESYDSDFLLTVKFGVILWET